MASSWLTDWLLSIGIWTVGWRRGGPTNRINAARRRRADRLAPGRTGPAGDRRATTAGDGRGAAGAGQRVEAADPADVPVRTADQQGDRRSVGSEPGQRSAPRPDPHLAGLSGRRRRTPRSTRV